MLTEIDLCWFKRRSVGLIFKRMIALSKELANFVCKISYGQLEREIIEQAKKCLLDFVGVSLLGSSTDTGRILIDFMKSAGGVKESTIIGGYGKVPCINAAFVNGAIAHIHELDDGHRFAMGHPGVRMAHTHNPKFLIYCLVRGSLDILTRITSRGS